MLHSSNILWPKSNSVRTPAPCSICRRIRELRAPEQFYAVAHILRDSSPAPVPWMAVVRTTERSSLRHEAELLQTREPGAQVARWHRVLDAGRVSTAKRRLTSTRIIVEAYTVPTTGPRPETSQRGF